MKFIKEDLVYGAVYGIVAAFWIGWISLAIAAATAILWAVGGMAGKDKAYRRLGCPAVVAVAIGIVTGHWLAAAAVFGLGFAALSIGYGIPTYAPGRPDHDEGSAIGRFWFKVLFGVGDEKLANILTRGTAVLIAVLSIAIPMWVLS